MENPMLTKFELPEDVFKTINHENVFVPETREQLVKLAIGGQQSGFLKSLIKFLSKAEFWKQL